MKKIIYLIIVIPILVVMLFSQSKVHGFDFIEWRPETDDLFFVVDIDLNMERAYLGYVSDNLGDAIVYFETDVLAYGSIINYIGDMVIYSEGMGRFSPVNPLNYYVFAPGDKLWPVGQHVLSNGVETITLFNETTNKYFVYRKDLLPEGAPYYTVDNKGIIGLPSWDSELYNYIYNLGVKEERDYWNSIIDTMLDNEYNLGYDFGFSEGYLEALYDNIGDVPTWVINGGLKVNDDLYNYIDYDNLIYYENVGQVVINGSDIDGSNGLFHKNTYIYVYSDIYEKLGLTNLLENGLFKNNLFGNTYNKPIPDKDTMTMSDDRFRFMINLDLLNEPTVNGV